MIIDTISANQASDNARKISEVTKNKRSLFRILSWKPVEVKVDTAANSIDKASEEIDRIKTQVATKIQTEASVRSGDIYDAHLDIARKDNFGTYQEQKEALDKTTLASKDIVNKKYKELTGVVKATEDFKSQYTRCAVPSTYIIKLEVKAVSFTLYESIVKAKVNEKLSNATVLRKTTRKLIGNSLLVQDIQDKVAKELDPVAITFPITYTGTEVFDFFIDPERIAIEAAADAAPAQANAKLVTYGNEFRNAIMTTQNRAAENMGLTKSAQEVTDQQIVQRGIDRIKNKIKNTESEALKKVQGFLKNKTKMFSSGNTTMEITDKTRGDEFDTGNKARREPGSQGVETKAGLAALKMNKFYQNLSKKVWYNPSPFSFEYKGWKPNILGKWFASDNVKGVKTWKRNLGALGDKAIAIAGIAAMIKGIEIAIERSGFGDQLEAAAAKAKEFNKTNALPASRRSSGGTLNSNVAINDGRTIFDKSVPQSTKSNIQDFVRKI